MPVDVAALKAVLEKHAAAETKKTAEVKEASEGELNERLSAFEFGVEVFCKQAGVEKAALSQAAGLKTPEALAPALVTWLTQETQQAQ
jgi:hypothetical protein